MTITHLNPPTLEASPAFSQGVLIGPGGRLVVVGGQNGIDGDGNLVSDQLGPQAAQALRNVLTVLDVAGATQEDVAKLTIYIAAGGDVNEAYAAAQEVWGPHPTAVSVVFVTAVGRPGCLVEVEALAHIAG